MFGGVAVEKGLLTMSIRERDRLRVMQALAAGQMRQAQAAEELGVSVRQIKRLLRGFRNHGPAALVDARRGRPSNRRLPASTRARAIELVGEHYRDFGPTLAQEYLAERHGVVLSVESLRQLMIGAGLWRSRAERRALHPPRERRPRFGELIQIDGSLHRWFEDRGPRCTLMVFIDDATSRITYARFAPAETTFAYFEGLRAQLAGFGRPLAFYSDQHSIFRINTKEAQGAARTQFQRVLGALGIEHIAALSPQAKGRVERAYRTLQDRLVKALRLANIDSLEAANTFLPGFVDSHNARFASPADDPRNAHRPCMLKTRELEDLLCLHYERKIDRNLIVQFERTLYQIRAPNRQRRLAGRKLTVLKDADQAIRLRLDNQDLPYRILKSQPKLDPPRDRKTLDLVAALATPIAPKPRPNHPWKKWQPSAKATNASRPDTP